MSRIRSIHADLFTDEGVCAVSPLARLLWLGIWTQSDDHGVFEWKPFSMKIKLMPVDNVDIDALLGELVTHQQVMKVEFEGRQYGLVRNFCRFQRPRKPSYKHPFLAEWGNYTAWKDENSLPVPHQSPTGAEKRSHRRGEKGSRREGEKTNINKTERESSSASSVTPSPSAPATLSQVSEKVLKEVASTTSKALGAPLLADWTPDDELCEELKREFGMTEEDIRTELLGFHAYHAQAGSFSANWRASFMTWGKRWKEHRDKQPAPRVELSRSAPTQPFVPAEADWDALLSRWVKNNSAWSRQFGPEPGMSGCKCPPAILEKHGIDPATGMMRRKAVSE